MQALMVDENVALYADSGISDDFFADGHASDAYLPAMAQALIGDRDFSYKIHDGMPDEIADAVFEREFGAAEKISIGHLSKPGHCFLPDEKAGDVYEALKLNPAITEFVVVEGDIAVGFLTRTIFSETLGGQYGFSLFAKNPIREIMKTDFLSVDYHMPVEKISALAMQRSLEQLYDPIVVECEGKYLGIVTIKNLLDTCTRIAVSERNEIAAMKDSLKIGLFFMNRDFAILGNYSQFLEELLSDGDLRGKSFTDILSASLSPNEREAVKDYLGMVFDGTFNAETLCEINPLHELRYVTPSGKGKIFHCEFLAVEMEQEETVVLATIYDVTAKTELQERLEKEKRKRHDEMSNLFELLQVDHSMFEAFQEDMEHEFGRIDDILADSSMSSQAILVSVYQSIHSIKSNAVTLGLSTFGARVHEVETRIKKLRDCEDEVPFDDMLSLTFEIEKLAKEKEGFGLIIGKINAFKAKEEERKSSEAILIESLHKTADRAAADMEKKVRFVAADIDPEAVEKGPRQAMKEVLMQLVRNSVAHGIESPADRLDCGKKETGIIRLSIKAKGQNIHVKLGDDGRGLDYKKIAEKALQKNIIKAEDAQNKEALFKALFSPGFSTASAENVHAGRGIGLNLVQDRVRAAKGSLTVQTELGKGAVFNIVFPANRALCA